MLSILRRRNREIVIPMAPAKTDAETVALVESFENVVGGVDALMRERDSAEAITEATEDSIGATSLDDAKDVEDAVNDLLAACEEAVLPAASAVFPAEEQGLSFGRGELIVDVESLSSLSGRAISENPEEDSVREILVSRSIFTNDSDSKFSESQEFARFKQVYSSRDGALCVYEDECGHLVSVDSSKLA